MKYDFLDSFPTELFESKEDYLSIYQSLEKLKKNKVDVQEILDDKKLRKDKTLEEIFSIFLIKISEILHVHYFREIAFFVCLYWKFILKKLDEEGANKEKNPLDVFMKNSEDPSDSSLITAIEEYKKKEKSFLGDHLNDMTQALNFKQHFRNWLSLCNFTEIKTNIFD